jgi:mannitol-specific phosphotransferase system IIBC component
MVVGLAAAEAGSLFVASATSSAFTPVAVAVAVVVAVAVAVAVAVTLAPPLRNESASNSLAEARLWASITKHLSKANANTNGEI